jgi:hypothetical protein
MKSVVFLALTHVWSAFADGDAGYAKNRGGKCEDIDMCNIETKTECEEAAVNLALDDDTANAFSESGAVSGCLLLSNNGLHFNLEESDVPGTSKDTVICKACPVLCPGPDCCAGLSTEKKCTKKKNSAFCEWQGSACVTRPPPVCSELDTRKKCRSKKKYCSWIFGFDQCTELDTTLTTECSDITKKGSCWKTHKQAFTSNCYWSNKACTNIKPECSTNTKEKVCVKNGCSWTDSACVDA